MSGFSTKPALLALAVLASGCSQTNAADELAPTLQALTDQLAQQQAMLQTMQAGGQMPHAATPAPSHSPPPEGLPVEQPPSGDPHAFVPTGAPPDAPPLTPGAGPPTPPSVETAFFSASAETALSAIPSFGPPTLRNSVWSGTPLRLAFLAERALPESTMLVFRDNDLSVVAPDRLLSFRVDYAPTAMACRQLWPCVAVIDENAVVFAVHYEVAEPEQPGQPATLFVLDCLTRDQIEGGAEFPTDEALLENGGLVARHRTADLLCVRRLGDPGLTQVRIESGPRGP